MAHLILFPDILNEIDGKGELNGAGELPVRKRPVPLSGNSSSVSGLTSSGANMSIGSNSHHKRFSPDPDPDPDPDQIQIQIQIQMRMWILRKMPLSE